MCEMFGRAFSGVLAAMIAAVMVVLSGCGSGSAPSTGTQPGTGSKPAQGARTLKWGADASGGAPFVYTDPNNPDNVIGFEVEIMDKLAAEMGGKPELVKGAWDALLAGLKSGRSDLVVNGIEINDVRKETVLFSEPYYVYEQMLTVRAEDKDKYKTLDDLKGKKIGTLSAAEANNVLKKAGWAEDQIVSHDDSATPYRSLEQGRVDAVLQENIIALYYASPERMPKLYNVPKTFAQGQYGIAVRKEDAALMKEIDAALKKLKESGELAAIYKKWNIWSPALEQIGIKEKK